MFFLESRIDYEDMQSPIKTVFKFLHNFIIDTERMSSLAIDMKNNVFVDNTNRVQFFDNSKKTEYLTVQ